MMTEHSSPAILNVLEGAIRVMVCCAISSLNAAMGYGGLPAEHKVGMDLIAADHQSMPQANFSHFLQFTFS